MQNAYRHVLGSIIEYVCRHKIFLFYCIWDKEVNSQEYFITQPSTPALISLIYVIYIQQTINRYVIILGIFAVTFPNFFVDADSAYRILCRFISNIVIICSTDIPPFLRSAYPAHLFGAVSAETVFSACCGIFFSATRSCVLHVRPQRQLYFCFYVKKYSEYSQD